MIKVSTASESFTGRPKLSKIEDDELFDEGLQFSLGDRFPEHFVQWMTDAKNHVDQYEEES